MMATTLTPIKVERGMVLPGDSTLSAGMVADSNPKKAQRVKAAVATIEDDKGWSVGFNGENATGSNVQKHIIPIAISGSSLSPVATN